MCGIAGFYQRETFLSQDHLNRMTDVQVHRGPDAEGFFFSGKVGLGHRRLSIIDLSRAANQPMVSHNGKARIVFNGEIYNYREIAEELQLKWKTTSDTEVLLEAYMAWGTSFVHRLNGMFTIAIYDEEKDVLFLCRDRMGIKPLYYYWDGAKFVFSSELKGILALRPDVTFSLNKKAVKDFLLLGYVPEPISICNEIQKFPSGSFAILQDGKLKIDSYWQPENFVEKDLISDEIYASQH